MIHDVIFMLQVLAVAALKPPIVVFNYTIVNTPDRQNLSQRRMTTPLPVTHRYRWKYYNKWSKCSRICYGERTVTMTVTMNIFQICMYKLQITIKQEYIMYVIWIGGLVSIHDEGLGLWACAITSIKILGNSFDFLQDFFKKTIKSTFIHVYIFEV